MIKLWASRLNIVVALTMSLGKSYTRECSWTVNYFVVVNIIVWLWLDGRGTWLQVDNRNLWFVLIYCDCMCSWAWENDKSHSENLPRSSIAFDSTVPASIPRAPKSTRDAASLSRRWLDMSIWPRALCLLDHRQGSFTALICFDSVIEEHNPFGEPKSRIIST